MVLEYLAARDTELTFKGGTCLAKVRSGFYRLSEDLDFGISTPPNVSRKKRSRRGGRLGPIVRDIFDVDHAVLNGRLDVRDRSLLELLRRKLKVAGAGAVDVSADRLGQLRGQLEGELQPVLRKQDFDQFDLERAIRTVRAVALQLV